MEVASYGTMVLVVLPTPAINSISMLSITPPQAATPNELLATFMHACMHTL